MARWVGGLAASSYLPCAGGFLTVVLCVLAVATVVAALCATHSREEDEGRLTSGGGGCMEPPAGCFSNLKSAPKWRGRALMNTLSSKRLLFSKKWRRSDEEEDEVEAYDSAAMDDGDFLWQKHILMGERCQPLNFSGLIVYDDKGNRLPQLPLRSPIQVKENIDNGQF